MTDALILIINFIFDTYIFILLVRFLLQKLGANWHSPILHLVIKLTQPIVSPMRKIFPQIKGFELAILVPMLLLEWLEVILLMWLKFHAFPGISGSLLVAVGMLGNKIVNLYFFAIIINAIMSWVPAIQHSPIAGIITTITNPPLALARRFIPLIAGLDLSPIPVLIFVKLLTLLIFNPIIAQGYRLF